MVFLWNPWNVLTRYVTEKKKGHFVYIGGRAVLITTGTKLLDTKYAFCGFNDDLITNEYHCHTASFSRHKTRPHYYL